MNSCLNFASSLLFNTAGTYKFMGMPIEFGAEDPRKPKAAPLSLFDRLSHLVSLNTLDCFKHEMCHVGMYRLFYKNFPNRVVMYCSGAAGTRPSLNQEQTRIGKMLGKQNSKILWILAGPVFNMVLTCIHIKMIEKVIIPFITNNIINTHLVDCKRFFGPGNILTSLTVAASFWSCFHSIINENVYAFSSALDKDDGDFGLIRKNTSNFAFTAACVALAVPSVFGLYSMGNSVCTIFCVNGFSH